MQFMSLSFSLLLDAILITLVQDVKTAPIAIVLRVKYSVKWASGSVQQRTKFAIRKSIVA